MMLRRWAIREHFVSGACPIVFKFYTQLVVPFGVYDF